MEHRLIWEMSKRDKEFQMNGQIDKAIAYPGGAIELFSKGKYVGVIICEDIQDITKKAFEYIENV
jgi:hypothetical protein